MFAYRTRDKVVKLAPGQERLFRLPPMTQGQVIAKVYDAEVRSGPHGEITSHSGQASDLLVTLEHPGLAVADANSVRAESLWQDAYWRLRIRRHDGPGVDENPYRVSLSYPSVLPIVVRRIPALFFQRGFNRNWNDQKYVHVTVESDHLVATFDDAFAQAFGIADDDGSSTNARRVLQMWPDFVATPGFGASWPIRLGVGAGPSPVTGRQTIFVSAGVHIAGGGEIAVRAAGLDWLDVDFPEDFSIVARFYLNPLYPEMTCHPQVMADYFCTRVGDEAPGMDGTDVAARLNRLAEDELGDICAQLSRFLQPWLVGGDHEVYDLDYERGAEDVVDANGDTDEATGHLLVSLVGDRAEPFLDGSDQPLTAGEGQVIGASAADGSEPLFSKAELRAEAPDRVPGTTTAVEDNLDPATQLERAMRLRKPPSIGALEKVGHIVVLMQENRSFDQILGYLSREAGRTNVDGLNNLPHDHTNLQVNHFEGVNYWPRRAAGTAWPDRNVHGPGHDYKDVAGQMQDGMGGFVKNWVPRAGRDEELLHHVMEYFGPDQLPTYAQLAEEFAICQKWFCAHPGPTWPNRFVYLTGDLSHDRNDQVEIDNPRLSTMIPRQTPLLMDVLTEHGITWKVFEHGYSFPRLFGRHTFDTTNILPFDDPTVGFEATAISGLPQVTFIEPDYIDAPPGNDDHPPADLADGQLLVARIMKALVSSPSWERTLFLITYDEHGGFYDHVVPPNDLPSLRAPNSTGLGPRVPAFVVSPLIPRQTVLDRVFDHTSVGATILRTFLGGWPPSVSARMNAAGDVREALTLDAPRPGSDFDAFRNWTPPVTPPRDGSPSRLESRPEEEENDDFHWMLAAARLITGAP